MKKIILSIFTIIALSTSIFAQAPEGFKYQAVVRGASNAILTNQSVGMQLKIIQGSAVGTVVYTETFATSTNAYGLVNLEIGTGTTSNTFSTINWANGPYFIETAVDVTGGTTYAVMGTSQLMSVPYALHSKTADSALIDMVNDADNDTTNEIQTISVSTDTLFLTKGGFAKLPSGTSGSNWALTGNNIYNTNSGYVGIGTSSPLYNLSILDTNAKIALGAGGSFNSVTSGKLIFQEDVLYNGFCGFDLSHNGATNNLSLFAGCTTPDTIFRANRSGYMNIKKLGIGSISQNPAFPLTVVGASGFTGNVTITGNLSVSGSISKGSGTFRIDHPLDPANKYLVHSFVESPEMMNIYSGNIVTDANGYATVILPAYFEAANKDFRYQLTVIGTFADAIIKEKISDNSFVIQTNEPNVEVSWSVTGVRADKYANKHRVEAEEEKEVKGTYVHPELYNVSQDRSVNKQKEKLLLGEIDSEESNEDGQ